VPRASASYFGSYSDVVMHPSPAVGFLAAASATATTAVGPQVTELVPVRPNAHDSSWPPVLVFCVVVVVLGGLFAAIVFLRRAWDAGHTTGGPLDG
jgi:hypothetical protein